jgi:hypothetical protein
MPRCGTRTAGQGQLADPSMDTPLPQPLPKRADRHHTRHNLILAGGRGVRRFPVRESLPVIRQATLWVMTVLTDSIDIAAPAEQVWQVIAAQFDRIGAWATAIPTSTPAPMVSGLADAGAPVPARVCHTGIRALPQVTETITAFDPHTRTLTYQATTGMPKFVTAARNTWTVTELGPRQCHVHYHAEFSTHGLIGWIVRPLLLARVGRDGKHLLADLKHYAETGRPSPRKQAHTAAAEPKP